MTSTTGVSHPVFQNLLQNIRTEWYIVAGPRSTPFIIVTVLPWSSASSPTPTPATATTCLSTFRKGRSNACSTFLRKKSPPYHATQDDVSALLQRLEVERITGHQLVRGRVIAVMYKAHWTGLFRPSWEREMDLPPALTPAGFALLGWHSEPTPRQTNSLHRQMRMGAAQRELSRANGQRFLAPGYGREPRADWLRHCSTPQMGPIVGTKPMTACGGWGKSALAQPPTGNIWYVFLDHQGPIKVTLSPAHYRNSTGSVRGSWGAFNSVGVDQLRAGLNVTWTNLKVRTWPVDVESTTALEYLILFSRF